MKRQFLAVLGLITLSVTLSACGKMQALSKPADSNTLSAPSTDSADNTPTTDSTTNTDPIATTPANALAAKDAKNLVNFVIGASAGDLKIANNFALAPALGLFTFIEILTPLALTLSESAINCMNFKIVNFAKDNYDFLLSLSCRDAQGTIELKNNKDAAGNNYSLFMNTQTPNLNDNSQFTLTQSHDSLALRKQTDKTVKVGDDTLEFVGSGLSQFTPSSGDYSVSQTLQFISNGDDLGSFTITAAHLHSSACGLDSGSFEITSGDTTLHVLVNSCGKTVITQDGLLVP